MPHYILVTPDGESLGAVELAGYDWWAAWSSSAAQQGAFCGKQGAL